MKIFSALLLVLSLFLTSHGSSNESHPYNSLIGKEAIVKEQSHLFNEPSTYERLLSLDRKKDMRGMKKLLASQDIKWIYKGYVVKIEQIDGDLARVNIVRPMLQDPEHGDWWIVLEKVRIRESN